MRTDAWLPFAGLLAVNVAAAAEPLGVRLENFTVLPSTGPAVYAQVRNFTDDPLQAAVRVHWPAGWKGAPAEKTVSLGPRATGKVAFTIEKAIDLAANRYAVVLEARAGDIRVMRTQQVVCATAPYLQPQIDGQLGDWQDAVPITFLTGGKATTVMTCWNRRQFCVAVRVQTGSSPTTAASGTGAFVGVDAVQFALAAEPRQPLELGKSRRHEFVVRARATDSTATAIAAGASAGKGLSAQSFRLLRPGDALPPSGQTRPLDGSETEDVQAAVGREGDWICYEIAVLVKQMPELRPTPGRAFRFSLLVHDAAGGQLRDLGTVMNFWPDQRQPDSWCRWPGSAFGPTLPWDSNGEFGFCSSIH